MKYKLNKKSLTFTRVHTTIWTRLLLLFSHLSLGVIFAVAALIMSYNWLETPRQKSQKRELDNIKLQYQILNDQLDKISELLTKLQDKDDNVYRVIFEASPIPASIRQAGIRVGDDNDILRGFSSSNLLIDTKEKVNKILGMEYIQSKSYDEVYGLAKNKEKMLASIPAIQPISINQMRKIGSFFGVRTDPFKKTLKSHKGIDFDAPIGTPVYAAGNGFIAEAGQNSGGFGNCVVINHGYHYETLYAHLSRIFVRPGQKILRGQILGYVGSTGLSTGPHLHYEVHKDGIAIDPIYFFFNDITSVQFKKMLELAMKPSQTMD